MTQQIYNENTEWMVKYLEDAGYGVVPPVQGKPERASVKIGTRRVKSHWPFYCSNAQLHNQDQVWVNAKGEMFRIEDMTLEYCANVLRFLRAGGHTNSKLLSALRVRLIQALVGQDQNRPTDISFPATYKGRRPVDTVQDWHRSMGTGWEHQQEWLREHGY